MYRTASDRPLMWSAALVVVALGAAQPAAAASTWLLQQEPSQKSTRIISSEIAISREQAELKLELANGRKLTLATIAGSSRGVLRNAISGAPDNLTQTFSFGVERGEALDKSWRELLNAAMDTPTEALAGLLTQWEAPAGGEPLDQLLDNALTGAPMADPSTAEPDAPQFGDSLNKLQDKIVQLQEALEHMETEQRAVEHVEERGIDWYAPMRHVGRGVAGVLSLLVTFAVLFGLGFALIFFGGRNYLEGVADATRNATMRSFLVGLAASFLMVPVFVLGIVVLAISIVGIPALLIWVPAFPLGVVLSLILGYLAVAHSAGEAFAERRFYGGDWFSRANSYYYLITGLGLLLLFFLVGNVVQMAGPWLGFLRGILGFLGGVLTWAALTTGFGAVLITRAGTRPLKTPAATQAEMFGDAANV
jgi:hypothetical protein